LEENSAERKKYYHFEDMFYNLKGFENINGYVTSSGACYGDSGGPAYVKEGNKYIVTGTYDYKRPLGLRSFFYCTVHSTWCSAPLIWAAFLLISLHRIKIVLKVLSPEIDPAKIMFIRKAVIKE
jgi:hypothetical protein